MATTTAMVREDRGQISLTVTFTAQNDAVVFQPIRAMAMSIQSTGAFTASHIQMQVSNDGVTYTALPTTPVDLLALGVVSIDPKDLGYKFYKVIMTAASEAHSAFINWFERS